MAPPHPLLSDGASDAGRVFSSGLRSLEQEVSRRPRQRKEAEKQRILVSEYMFHFSNEGKCKNSNTFYSQGK